MSDQNADINLVELLEWGFSSLIVIPAMLVVVAHVSH